MKVLSEYLEEASIGGFLKKNRKKQKDLFDQVAKRKKELNADIKSADEFLKLRKIQRANP